MSKSKDNEKESIKQTASILKSEWNQRSMSDRANFYIASHPGWQEPDRWSGQAQIDANLVLLGLDDLALSNMDVLEIGCGNGRLVPHIAPRVKSYAGFDICGKFIEDCRNDLAQFENVRFAETDGSSVPEEFLGLEFDLIFAAAVFIHCPHDIIEAYLTSISDLVKRPSRVRFQVLADPEDLSEIIPVELLDPKAHEQSTKCHDEAIKEQLEADESEFVEDSSYLGYQFRIDELRKFLKTTFSECSEIHLIRFDPLIVNCEVTLQ